jgi:hypothetical protein
LERQGQKFDLVQDIWKGIERIKLNTRILDGTGELKQDANSNATRTSPTLVHSFRASHALLSTALLYTESSQLGAIIGVNRLPAQNDALVICLQFENATDYFYYNPQPDNMTSVRFGDFSFSGDFCHVRLDCKGHTSEVRIASRISNLDTKFSQIKNDNISPALYAIN